MDDELISVQVTGTMVTTPEGTVNVWRRMEGAEPDVLLAYQNWCMVMFYDIDGNRLVEGVM